ncbi:MAG: adenylate/guanylate cyclase domain-containing protein, partial [bacterium]
MERSRRDVTVMFVDVTGYTALSESLDPEIVKKVMDELLSRCGDVVERYGGTVDKYMGDAVMAEFGVNEVHEDDPERAVKTVLDIRDSVLPDFNRDYSDSLPEPLSVSAGLHRGLAVTGSIGRGESADDTVTGDAVNTAKRLEEEAQAGEIYLSEDLFTDVRHMADGELLDPISLKGRSEPVTARKLTGERSRDEHGHPVSFGQSFVGREEEFKRCSNGLQHVLEGSSVGYLCKAGAGRGKSRLIEEVLGDVDSNSVRVFRTGAFSFERDVSLGPVQRLLEKIVPVSDPSRVREHIHNRFNSVGDNLLSRLEEVLSGHRLNERQEGLGNVLRELVRSISEEVPLILFFDDLHWYDETSLEFVSGLASQVMDRSVALVGAYRPKPFTRSPVRQEKLQSLLTNWESHLDRCVRETLGPLSEREARQLTQQYIPNDGIPEEIVERIVNVSSGVPFVIIQYLNAYFDAGCFVRNDNNVTYRFEFPEQDVEVPGKVQDLVLSRIDNLGELGRLVCGAGIVLGDPFRSGDVIEILDDFDDREISRTLSELRKRGFLERGEQPETLQFQHDAITDALRPTFLREQIKTWHERALQLCINRGNAQPEELLRHAEGAEAPGKAIELSLEMVRDLAQKTLWERVRSRCQDILEWTADSDHPSLIELRAYYLKSLAYTEADVSEEELEERSRDLIQDADRIGNSRGRMIARSHFHGFALRGDFSSEEGRNYINEAVQLGEEDSRAGTIPEVCSQYARQLETDERFEKAIEWYETTLNRAETMNDRFTYLRTLLNLSRLLRNRDCAEEADRYLRGGVDELEA